MSRNQEQIERVTNLLKQAGAALEAIDITPCPSPAEMFMRTLAANLDNDKLSDADFRQLVRNSLPGIAFPEDRHVVMTNRGEAYRALRRWADAEKAFGAALANARTHPGKPDAGNAGSEQSGTSAN